MGDLKTTAEERAKAREHGAAALYGLDASYTRRATDDLDTLIAENAKLRAVAEAAKFVCSRRRGSMLPQAIDDLDEALAALEAP